MKTKLIFQFLLLSTITFANLFAKDIPLVYDVENTGASFAKPVLPSISELPIINPLTDPFEWSDCSGRDTSFASWSRRRAEIKAEIEHYEIGPKPVRPENIRASYVDGTLTVNVTVNGDTLTLTSAVALPSGDGPFPAVIGIGRGTGSLPSDIFSSRNVAQISFNFGQVMSHTQKRGQEPINMLYPELTYMGAYSAWPWGISRIIDGLELVQDDLPIDLKHLAVTGCSFAGKMALFAGAFDERIALTIAQEPGGGGAAAWRVSETLGKVETLKATSHAWFIEDMFKFSNSVSKLPHDHHELMAMVAPRALLVLGNPDYKWLAEESGYVSCRGAHEVWKKFGISNRFGFSIVAEHGHCQLPNSQRPEVEAFVDKFLLGDMTANTNVTKNPYDHVDYARWIKWWGTGDPTLPKRNTDGNQILYFEPECAKIGKNWDIKKDAGASGGYYVTVKSEKNSVETSPSAKEDQLTITFTAETDTTYHISGRLDCPTADDDSFWIKMDDGTFEMANNLGTNGWEWASMTGYALKAGEHTLTIAYRENGAKLDKICISNLPYTPEGMGEDAINRCNPTGFTKEQPGKEFYPNESARQEWLNVDYAGDSLIGHKMDIHLPEKGDGPFPIIVSIAGSAWFSNNSKERAFQIASPLLQHGFAVVAVNHRSSREAVFPAQINDIKGVVRFLRANASKYKLDPRFIGITGDSSGGHLSALMATSDGVDKFTVGDITLSIEGNVGGNTDQSSKVDAVVDWYGPANFLKMDSQGSDMKHNASNSPESILLGGPIQESKDLCAFANPITYIDADDPPFLIIHGDADPLVPHGQSILLHDALTEKKVKNQLIIIPGGGHGIGIWTKENIDKMVSFFVEAKDENIASRSTGEDQT